jgi:putative transposase
MSQVRHQSEYVLPLEEEYSGMGVPELKRMKELEAENRRLKRMYSELSMENDALKELISKKL